jgi:thymidylate synthase
VTALDDHYAVAANLSEGWLDAVRMLDATPSYKAIHLVIRILDPVAEDAAIRAAAQALIDEHNAAHEDRPNQQKPDIDTTRNTIFPARWAQRTNGPAELVAYYRERYTRDGLLGFGENRRGTYFGRIVAYPRGDGQEPADQLGDTIRKLKDEGAKRNPKSSRYEINVYNERKDRSPTSFPCLAHLSVHLHERRLHMQAIYRNEFLIGRAYGNYLGLGQLQAYIAKHAEVDVGEQLMTLGHVQLDANKTPIRAMLRQLDAAA